MVKKRGARSETIRLDKLLQEQQDAFRKKFGRDPGPDDPVFFDPDKDEPTQVSMDTAAAEVMATMKKTGTRPELIYAYEKTGLVRALVAGLPRRVSIGGGVFHAW